jgi:putative transposase
VFRMLDFGFRNKTRKESVQLSVSAYLYTMTKKKQKEQAIESEDLYERLQSHLKSKAPLWGKGSPFSEMLQGLVNRMLEGEIESHLELEEEKGELNKRNGYIEKEVKSGAGVLQIKTPRDRIGSFTPVIVEKRERSLSSGLDDQILALYAQGNSVEDVRRLLMRIYGVELSSGQISHITDKVLPELQAWRERALQAFYAVVYLDAIYFKVRYEGRYETRAFYTVYAIDWEGNRDLLGMYVQGSEGSARWGTVLMDLKKRGVEDILVACTDDLAGFSDAITEVFPKTIVQKCIVHQVRNSLKFVDDKDSKKLAVSLRKIYSAITREGAQSALDLFDAEWGAKYAYITEQWQSKWDELTAFLDFPQQMQRMIYTTNPVEALHRIVRKIVKSKAAWVSDQALMKQLFLSLTHNEESWKRKALGWKAIQRELANLYPGRVPKRE